MTSKIGLHWMRVHPDGRDLDHVAKMQYPSVKLFEWHWSDADACANLQSVLPRDSYILARDHPLSEQEIWSDPVGIGTRHANEWADKVHSGRYKLPTDRSFFLGRNEPDATTGDRNAIDLYTEAFLRRLSVHGLRGGGFNFSTGHPRTVDGTGNTPADYSVFERSHQAIVAGDHIGVLHIYGTAAHPCLPGHYDRLKSCPWQDVQWVVGEMGDDEWLTGSGDHIGYKGPFNGHLHDYCAWLDTLILGINDPRIHSYQVFTYDYSHPWSSFDVRDIRDALEGYQWRHMQVAPTKPFTTHLPSVGTGTPPQPEQPQIPYGSRIATTVTANLRSWSSLQAPIIREVPPGTVFDMVGYDGDWYQVPRGDGEGDGWLHKSVVAQASEPPPQHPQPTGDDWGRVWPITLNIEGGLSTDRSDPGNYRPDGTFVGTKWGISALSHPTIDIVNLTKEQALDIYRRDYWQGSGADKLPWPLNLLHFDAYVQNQNAAQKFLAASGGDPDRYMAERIDWYTRVGTWDSHGRGWMRRCATMLREASR